MRFWAVLRLLGQLRGAAWTHFRRGGGQRTDLWGTDSVQLLIERRRAVVKVAGGF